MEVIGALLTGMKTEGDTLNLVVKKVDDTFSIMLSKDIMEDYTYDVPISKATYRKLSTRVSEISDELSRLSLSRGGLPSQFTETVTTAPLNEKLKQLGNLIFTLFIRQDFRGYLSDIKDGNLILSTNDVGIPWELMHDGNKFLCLRYPISRKVQVSKPRFGEIRQIDPQNIRMLFISDPKGDLAGAKQEVEKIVGILGSEMPGLEISTMVGKEADHFNLLSAICDYDIIHFACHGKFNVKEPEKSFIYLSDGELYAGELANRLSVKPPLIAFVNACESGRLDNRGFFQYDGRIAGLANSFISAGVQCFLGSPWPVYDDAAAHFAIQFYKSLVEGKTVGRSVLESRKSVFDKFQLNRIAWASFVLYGNPSIKIYTEVTKILSKKGIESLFLDSFDWILKTRKESGIWMDGVYREQGVLNTCEVLNIAFCTGRLLDENFMVPSIKFILSETDEKGFIASPYQPGLLKKDYNTTVVLVMITLAKAMKSIKGHTGLKKQMVSKMQECVDWLIKNQSSNGGWSWGRRSTKIPAYTYFTSNAIYYMINFKKEIELDNRSISRINGAIKKGTEWLYDTQHDDGGWGITEKDDNSDIISTGYALESLGYSADFKKSESRRKALHYLKRNLEGDKLTERTFEIDMPIILPNKPSHMWPVDEDYGGQASVLNGLLSCLENGGLGPEYIPLVNLLVENIVANKEPNKGWPKVYSTIYATAYNVHVLSRFLELRSK